MFRIAKMEQIELSLIVGHNIVYINYHQWVISDQQPNVWWLHFAEICLEVSCEQVHVSILTSCNVRVVSVHLFPVFSPAPPQGTV